MQRLSYRLFIISILSFIAFGLVYPFAPIELAPKTGLCILIVIAGLWMTEALPVAITALLIPVLATLLGLESLTESLANFASPVVFLVFGGFILSATLQKHDLDHWFAAVILQHCGTHTGKILIGMFAVTAFLSMWMSNASATLMMLPILMSIINRLPATQLQNTQMFALLGLAYSSSLGGIVTLIGTPANVIIGGQLGLDFFQWLILLGPACIAFFPLMIVIMAWKLKPNLNYAINVEINVPELNTKQKIVLLIFSLTCISWMTSGYLADWLNITSGMDTWIVMVTASILVLLNLLEWNDIEKHTQWGILLLSGGGMCLSALLESSGAGQWLAFNVIDRAIGGDMIIFVLVSIIFIILLTEMMSNAAAAALCMPILLISAESIHFPKELLAPLVGLTVSMAFMFPISTPPNAIVYGTGKIQFKEMISIGWILNIVAALFIFIYIMIR